MRRKYKKRGRKWHIPIAFLVILIIFCVTYYIVAMRPLLEEYVNDELANEINLTINRVTSGKLDENNITYDSLITLTKDDEGHIISLATKVGEMNKLKLDIEKELLETLISTEHITIEVPIGSLIGGEFFSGRGPCLKVRVVPVTRVYTEYDNRFDSAGINQTRHQVFLRYNVSLKVLLPGKRESTTINSEICVAETVIVGLIPDFYAGK